MRHDIIGFLQKELVGPDPIHPFVQKNGEEVIKDPPRHRYSAGILFPQGRLAESIDAVDDEEEKVLERAVQEIPEEEPEQIEGLDTEGRMMSTEELDSCDDMLNLSNAYMPSAMGFSFFVDIPDAGFKVSIRAGRYKLGAFTYKDDKGVPKDIIAFLRESLDCEILISKESLPSKDNISVNYKVLSGKKETGLIFNIRNRTSVRNFGTNRQLYTATLVNSMLSAGTKLNNENCFFQTGFDLCAQDYSECFLPYGPDNDFVLNNEEASAELLYRNHQTFALGHGCAPEWDAKGSKAEVLGTRIMPQHEIQPIVPTHFPDLSLSMYELGNNANVELVLKPLNLLVDKYEKWIIEQQKLADSIQNSNHKVTALKHIDKCSECLSRIKRGVMLIKDDDKVLQAFILMNQAMLTQQLRYGLKLRKWVVQKDKSLEIESLITPDMNNSKSWPDWLEHKQKNTKYGSWYPFQLAFILMSLSSTAKADDRERELVDLIWFPTGGGKTEAYLGLTAFTIFLKKLKGHSGIGTVVLMRYTLRLLTAQQFQRAASLICACEMIRKRKREVLGDEEISIGLWVGEGLSPNKRASAVRDLKKMHLGTLKESPFILLKCPWCGAQTGLVDNDPKHRTRGYRLSRNPSTVKFVCHDSDCDFSSDASPLPLVVIDEDIYEKPPTLIIGTVDKFAMIPWIPAARSIFGFRDDEKISAPELIIQDELHLISGPLGSMVGHYEALIAELCTITEGESKYLPKIIASTATISRAPEQCHNLYACGTENVFLFPPQCIDAGETFFATIDRESSGRIYLGIHATGSPSHATTQIRVVASLLQAVKFCSTPDESIRNYYWTILNYFNSLRELGHAATLVSADIREYLNVIRLRKGIKKSEPDDPRRFINKAIELTSRKNSNEIPMTLQELEIDYPTEGKSRPVDICLSTAMISVGVDIPRLGLMTVIGQPKTTSEYIQASSRVGRSKAGPGLVVTIYNTSRPRDRSHYERFISYHSKIYSEVEPTSVTPFAAPVRERALHALLVGYIRYFGSAANRNDPQEPIDEILIEKLKDMIKRRVLRIDPEECDLTMKLLEEKIQEWADRHPAKYGGFSIPDVERPLMFPAGTSPHEAWDLLSWPTQSSMRSIDATCEGSSIGRYTND